jgi:hypothetical protein
MTESGTEKHGRRFNGPLIYPNENRTGSFSLSDLDYRRERFIKTATYNMTGRRKVVFINLSLAVYYRIISTLFVCWVPSDPATWMK